MTNIPVFLSLLLQKYKFETVNIICSNTINCFFFNSIVSGSIFFFAKKHMKPYAGKVEMSKGRDVKLYPVGKESENLSDASVSTPK